MSKLSAIVRNRDEITVEIPRADGETTEPVVVTWRPRNATMAFREMFGQHFLVLAKLNADAQAAQARGDMEEVTRLAADPANEAASTKMVELAVSLIEGWDLEDEDEAGKVVAVPFPRTQEAIKAFVAPDMFQAVMQAVMSKLNPNQTAGEPSANPSPASS